MKECYRNKNTAPAAKRKKYYIKLKNKIKNVHEFRKLNTLHYVVVQSKMFVLHDEHSNLIIMEL